MDIGTAKPTPAEQAEVPHHLIDLVDADEDFTVSQFQAASRVALADIDGRGRRAVLVGGTGLYFRAVVDDLELPGRYPEVRAELEAEPDTAALHARLAGSTRWPPAAWSRPTGAGWCERSRSPSAAAGRSRRSVPVSRCTRRCRTAVVGLRMERRRARPAHRGPRPGPAGRRVRSTRCGRWLARPGGLSRTARQALGYGELLDHLARRARRSTRRSRRSCARTRRFARRQDRWFRRDPRITWVDAGQQCSRRHPRPSWETSNGCSSPSITASATTSSSPSTRSNGRALKVDGELARRCATAAPASAPTG